MEFGQLAAVFFTHYRFAIKPGIGIVEVNPRRFLLFLQYFHRTRAWRKRNIRRSAVAQGERGAVGTTGAQQNGDLGNVQRVGDSGGNSLDQGTGFHDAAHLIAEFTEYLFGVISFAKEAPIGPGAELFSQSGNAETQS